MSTFPNTGDDAKVMQDVEDAWEGNYTENDDENVIQNTKFASSTNAAALKEDVVKVVDGSKCKSKKKCTGASMHFLTTCRFSLKENIFQSEV